MNDEQFEAAMDYLGDEGQVSITQKLRVRDTTQREAQALLERELDRERERADMAEVELQHARAARAIQPEANQFLSAAAFVRNMATDYANEHGWDDMGGLSFGAGPQGTAKMDHFLFLEELAEKLRTMATDGGAGHA